MDVFYYNLSIPLKSSLSHIEQLRRQILLTPISPKTELRLRWEAMLNRIYWSLNLSGNPLTKTEMAKLLSGQTKKRLTPAEKEVINYSRALDYISQEWLVTGRNIQPKTILELYNLACSGRFRDYETNLRQMLNYLQASSENPVIQAGSALMQLVKLSPFTSENDKVARLLSLLFLYKIGYDFRGMLTIEEYFRHDLTTLEQVSQVPGGNLTDWLEYYSFGVSQQLEKALENFDNTNPQNFVPTGFWELNDRQKEVLKILEQPDISITNKAVQKRFKVSQITASRDLTKLASLGLIFAHGKGRSVYYTKV
ncbi:Fic family protein [Candidatus Microgenomates bacterium]|nr:Fic family protein [Candidatus Microgenomates bacterium]